VLVSPAALAVILPALAERVASAQDGGSDDPETMAGHLRRAVRHAVDPRNSELHPGVAMRIFEVGRDINPEASRRAAEAALESPHLHEAKRQRLVDWLAGRPIEGATSDDAPARASASPVADAPARQTSGVPARRPSAVPVPPANGKVVAQAPRADGPAGGPRIAASVLVGLDEDGLTLKGTGPGRLDWTDVQAVSVAELGGIATHPVIVIDLVSNWTRRGEERLEIVRLRVDELDLATLISRENAVGSDLASLLGDILERTRAVPLPDPESALGMRIARFETPEDYAREALRVGA